MKFKNLYQSPEILAVLILLTLGLAIVVVNVFAAPKFLTVAGIFVFFSIGFAILKGFTELAEFKTSARRKNSELQAVIQNLNDAVVIYTPEFEITEWNRAAEALFKLKDKEVVGKKITPELVREPRWRVLTQVLFPTLAPTVTQISDGWPQITDIVIDEPSLKVRSILHRVTDEKGESKGFLKIIQDLSREKFIAESKSEFLTVAAHQLRTPLTAIKWNFETIAGETAEAAVKENAQKGVELSDRMIKIVNDLLEAARIEEGKFGYQFEETSLTEFLKAVVGRAGLVAEEYGIKVLFTPPSKNYRVKIDKGRLEIALQNILDNAIRYNIKNGSVTVETEEAGRGKFIKINVRDTGIGIPEDELQKIFTKFHRGRNVVALEPNGSGLGLYITRNIIKSHGGEIGVSSALGRGTEFWFTLPLDFSLVPEKQILP